METMAHAEFLGRDKPAGNILPAVQTAATHAGAAVAAFVFAYGGGFAGISPFGVAFAAAVPFPYCVAAAAGACAGYTLSADDGAGVLRYSACVLAVVLLRVLAEMFLRRGAPRTLATVGAAVCTLVTGTAVLLVQGFSTLPLLLLLCESALAGGVCVLFAQILPRAESTAAQWLGNLQGNPRARLSLIFSLALLLAALTTWHSYGLSPAIALAALLTVGAAFIGGEGAGAAAGVAFSAVLLLRGESTTLGLMLCLGGVLCGALAMLGRFASAGIFAAVCIFFMLLNPNETTLTLSVQCLVGGGLFLCIPKAWLAHLRQSVREIPVPSADAQAATLLTDTSAALKTVRACVERVSQSLEELGNQHALGALGHEAEITARTHALREAVSEQLGGMEDILQDLNETLLSPGRYLANESVRAKAEALAAGLRCRAAVCTLDRWAHMRVVLTLAAPPGEYYETHSFVQNLESAVGYPLREIALEEMPDDTWHWEFAQAAAYGLEIQVAQRARGDARLCGDYYTQFDLPSGEKVLLLSDGMGTGGRAAVDSALTCTLFSTLAQADLSFACALRLTNAALMAKSAEESLATLDAAVFDPYSGELNLYKAGAAASILRTHGVPEKLESDSLPAGILRNISFAKLSRTLHEEDLCVLFSDGAVPETLESLEALIVHGDTATADLAQGILSTALQQIPPDEQDDATVIVLQTTTLQ
ncbi:MAG: SpoIIE family protein phosphatase [Oscillospiraceae bacterium]|nr:SpoIIE family protein phosphatase [Oscillospiraceae bacterium]